MLKISDVDASLITKIKRSLLTCALVSIGLYLLFLAAQLNGYSAVGSALLVPLLLAVIALASSALLYLACIVVVLVSGRGGSGA